MSNQDCEVCLESYNCEDRRPHCLTCGHSFCSSCLKDLLEQKPLICPHCRAPHRVETNSFDDVPVNYGLMSLIKGRTTETLNRDDIIRSLKMETEDRICVQKTALGSHMKSFRIQLKDLKGREEIGGQIRNEMTELMKYLDKTEKLVQQDMKCKEAALEDATAVSECLIHSQKTLREATTLKEIGIAEEEAIRSVEEAEPFLHRNQILISRKVLENTEKVHTECRAFLAKVKGQMTEPEPPSPPVRPKTSLFTPKTYSECRSFAAKVKGQMAEPEPTCPLLRPKTSLFTTKVLKGNVTLPMVEEALKRGRSMWVVTSLEGRPRRAQISKEGRGRLLLHAFQDGEPPAGSTVAEFESLCLLEGERRVFLEVSWGGERRGRVIIGMEGEGKHGQALLFRHFSLGDRGPSYVNTHFIRKEEDSIWSTVLCGVSERDDGRKDLSSSLMRNCKGIDSVPVEGTVYMDVFDLPCFIIITSIKNPFARRRYSIVGCVEEGLALVKEASDLPDITKVTVTDSGLVLGH